MVFPCSGDPLLPVTFEQFKYPNLNAEQLIRYIQFSYPLLMQSVMRVTPTGRRCFATADCRLPTADCRLPTPDSLNLITKPML
ncbi:MAG: hypothetical protein F6K55_12135 [Moorea sp. SIO4A3]|nr:hypothetical protein [Moorena sp. SIO4A3]